MDEFSFATARSLAPQGITSKAFAPSFQTVSAVEGILISGCGSAVFVTVPPLVSSAAGSALACKTVGCALGAFTAGSTAGGFYCWFQQLALSQLV